MAQTALTIKILEQNVVSSWKASDVGIAKQDTKLLTFDRMGASSGTGKFDVAWFDNEWSRSGGICRKRATAPAQLNLPKSLD